MNTTRFQRHYVLPACLLLSISCGDAGPAEEVSARGEINTKTCREGEVGVSVLRDDGGVDVVCVLCQCHGRTQRRPGGFDCKLDPDKKEVITTLRNASMPRAANSLALQVTRNKSPLRNLAGSRTVLYPSTDYQWDFSVDVRLGDELESDDLDYKVWIEDVFRGQGSLRTKTYKGFRCVATGFTLDTDATPVATSGNQKTYRAAFTAPMSKDCDLKGYDLSRQNAMREAGGWDAETFDALTKYEGSIIHVSYDVQGETVWHKTATSLDDVVNREPECVPNPTNFFYDSTTSSYRMSEFFKQREAGDPITNVYIPSPDVGRLAQLGPRAISSRRDLTVRLKSNVNTPLTVDYEYYVNNLNSTHFFNPFNPTSRYDGSAVRPGQAWNTSNVKKDNYAPTKMKADFYLVPVGTKIGGSSNRDKRTKLAHYKIGSRALSGADESTTISDSLNVPITTAFKKRFTDPDSGSYITNDSRAFTLAYCIDSATGVFTAFPTLDDGNATSPMLGMDNVILYTWKDTNGNPLVDSLASHWTLDYLSLDESRLALRQRHYRGLVSRSSDDLSAYLPFLDLLGSVNGPGIRGFQPGCRADPRPIVVTLDRFVTPVEQISTTGYQGSLDAKQTGDSKYGGGNDNLHDIQCERVAANDMRENNDDCDEMLQIGGRSDGADSRSLYAVQSNTTRGKNASNQREVSAGIQGEFMGFQLIDQDDDDSNPFASTPQGADPEITLEIQPPWEAIVSLLSATNSEGAVRTEWEKGYGVEQNGIGFTIGFKIPFQIGPVPVVVIISFTIGANLTVELSYRFAPEDGDEYPCLDTNSTADTNCAVLSSETKSFADASEACQDRGGRLAEMSTQAEYDQLQTLRTGPNGETVNLPGSLWLGGQAAYRVDDEGCIGRNTSTCRKNQTTEIRWVSNGESFARAQGTGEFNTDGYTSRVFGSGVDFSTSAFPTNQGVVWKTGDDTLTGGSSSSRHRYICTYDHADSETYHKFSVATPLTLAAGVGIQGCVPNPLNLFCLGAEVTFVEFELKPGFSYVIHNLQRVLDVNGSNVTQRSQRNFVTLSAIFQITLLKAEFAATLNLLEWLTLKWVIAKYDGIVLPSQKLYEDVFPSIGGWE